jgi:hypothetical protein
MTAVSHCEEVAEYVSALADGETIPSAFAQHIGACTACQARLHDYLAMGAELRRVASLDRGSSLPALPIEKRRTNRSLWKKGLETMRIPKLAFALLVIAVVALASSLTFVKVGAHSSGSVLMLKFTGPDGVSHQCFIDTTKKDYPCGMFGRMGGDSVGLMFRVQSRDGDRIQLGVQSKAYPIGTPEANHMGDSVVDNLPQVQYSFEVGQALKVDVESLGTVAITGEWTDHVPVIFEKDQNHLDPGPDQVRILSPLLLKDKHVIGDMEGASTWTQAPSQAVVIYYPTVGRLLISAGPMKGAVQADAQLNRISFQIEGETYVVLTGAPVSRSEKVWVLLQPDFKASGNMQGGFLTMAEVSQIAPEAVLPQPTVRR